MTQFIETVVVWGSLLIGLIAYLVVAWLLVRAVRRGKLGRFWATVIHGGASIISVGVVPPSIALAFSGGAVSEGVVLGVSFIGGFIAMGLGFLFAAAMLLWALIGTVRSRPISRWYQKRQVVAAAQRSANSVETPEKARLNAELASINAERAILRPRLVERKRILIGTTCIVALIGGGATVFIFPPATVLATLAGAGIGQIIARVLLLILKDQRLLSRTLREHEARSEKALRTAETAR
jgi:hypothetical protein